MNKVRILRFLSLIVCVVLVVAGCGKTPPGEQPISRVPQPEAEQTVETVEVEKSEISEFFEKYINTDERPVAVMIDNDNNDARPHAGLDEAYLIYELVVEGGATRFMAVFKGTDTAKIGPVRSSRHYFLDYVMENDAIYTHFGWSPKAITDISSFGINNINGITGGDENIFWREQKFKGDWHSAYTSIEKIKAKAKNRYPTETTKKNGIKYSEDYINLSEENVANDITLKYSHLYKTGYTYNAETGLYEKSINSKPHLMQSGEVLSVKNIIVELIADTSLGDGTVRRNINTTGTGKGYYFTNGGYEEITWSKASRRDNTVYKKTDGTELMINPGKTIINVISPSAGVVIE